MDKQEKRFPDSLAAAPYTIQNLSWAFKAGCFHTPMAFTGSLSLPSASCLLSSQQIKIRWPATETVVPLSKHTLTRAVSQKICFHQKASSHLYIKGTEPWVPNSSPTFRADGVWWCRAGGCPAYHGMFNCIYSLFHMRPKAPLSSYISGESQLMDQRKAWGLPGGGETASDQNLHQGQRSIRPIHGSVIFRSQELWTRTWWQRAEMRKNNTGLVWNKRWNGKIWQPILTWAEVKAVPGT